MNRLTGLDALLAIFSLLPLVLGIQHFAFSGQPEPLKRGRQNYDYATEPYLSETLTPARTPGESRLSYTARLSRYVHRSTYHCHYSAPGSLSALEQMFYPEWLFPQGPLVKERFECGQCAQRAYFLTELLREAGIAARVVGIGGHVVVIVDGYVFDPDFGVGPLSYSDPALYQNATIAYKAAPQDGFDYAALLADKSGHFIYDMTRLRRLDRLQTAYFALMDVFAAILCLTGLWLLATVGLRPITGRSGARIEARPVRLGRRS